MQDVIEVNRRRHAALTALGPNERILSSLAENNANDYKLVKALILRNKQLATTIVELAYGDLNMLRKYVGPAFDIGLLFGFALATHVPEDSNVQ